MLASESKAAVQFDGWLNRSDNMVLLPSTSKPKAVIHFLGGAFFGSVPHVFYRSFLESLSQQGYIIVATPFRLQMDYMVVCDEVIRRFDKVASELAREYGPLVVIGIGHSFGAVLQTLITSLFPDTPRAINILISFNGRGAVDAVPLYEEVVIPLSKQYELFRNESDNLSPSSTRISRVLSKPFDPFSALFNLAYGVKEQLNAFVTSSSSLNQPQFLSFYQQLTQFIDQIPLLLTEIAEGREEFTPSFQEVKEVCRRMYRARRTLVIQFKQDNLDNSEEITSTLREANTIMRMKRPMVEMDVQLLQLEGTHLTPLALGLQDISLLSTPTSSSSTRDRSSILGSSLKLPLPLRDCEGRDILMNTMKEPLNLNSLLEDINSYLNSNIK